MAGVRKAETAGSGRNATIAPLDNPVFHALRDRHRSLALHHGAAWRYVPEVSSFAGLPDTPDEDSWNDMRAHVTEQPFILIRDGFDVPRGWTQVFSGRGLQYVGAEVTGEHFSRARSLDASHVAAMSDLVKRTRPGPFAPRTIELGNYEGVFDGDRLVAMAGNRFRLAGYREISAVCTDPDYRGRGLGAALVRHLAALTLAEGDQPFLHVAETNTPAITLYERLGFTLRRHVVFAGFKPSAD
ncbi:MAG: GNAT family N-acetyltransferase [Acidimicrobiales bacterium]